MILYIKETKFSGKSVNRLILSHYRGKLASQAQMDLKAHGDLRALRYISELIRVWEHKEEFGVLMKSFKPLCRNTDV